MKEKKLNLNLENSLSELELDDLLDEYKLHEEITETLVQAENFKKSFLKT